MSLIGTSSNTNGQAHQVNNHQGSNSGTVLPSPEMYWGKSDIGEGSPPSMCLPANGQGSILGRQGSEGPVSDFFSMLKGLDISLESHYFGNFPGVTHLQCKFLCLQNILFQDDLRVNNIGQHHQNQSSTPTNPYDALATALASTKGAGASAFTPIQTVVLNNVHFFTLHNFDYKCCHPTFIEGEDVY